MLRGYAGLFKSYWPMLSFGLLSVFAGNFGQSFFVSWYGLEIQQSLGLSAAAYGSAYSGATLASGMMLMLMGGAIDRLALRLFITLAALGLTFAALLMWQANSFAVLIVALFLLRFCGQGLMPHTAMTAVGKYFTWNRGKAISIAASGVPLGEILLPVFAVTTIALFGWQLSWLLVALVIPLVLLPAMHFLLSKTGAGESDHESADFSSRGEVEHGTRRTMLRDFRFWLALPLVLGPPFIVTGLFIHQGYILAEKQWSSAVFASAFVVYGVIHWLASLTTGIMVDRISARQFFWSLGLPFVFGLLLGAMVEGVWVVYFMMAVLGAGIGMAGTLFNALWAEVYGTRHLGSIRSLTSSLVILSTSASPVILGIMIDQGASARQLLLLLCAYAFTATLLARFSFARP